MIEFGLGLCGVVDEVGGLLELLQLLCDSFLHQFALN